MENRKPELRTQPLKTTRKNSVVYETAPVLFLDTLPLEGLDHVLRFFSRIPKTENWVRHIELKDIIELYGVSGQLRIVLRRRFKSLGISAMPNCIFECAYFGWKIKIDSMLWTKNIYEARHFILAGGGESLQTLIVGQQMYSEKQHGEEMVEVFSKNCSNLTALCIYETGKLWASKFANRLGSLQIAAKAPMSIPSKWANLCQLNLYSLYEDNNWGTEFWKKVGLNLESLTITFDCLDSKYEIEQIQGYCKKIQEVFIHGAYGDNCSISALLVSYGKNLKYAFISDMDEGLLRNVKKSCTNALFSLSLRELDLVRPTLNILGTQVDKINFAVVSRNSVDTNFLEITSAWNQCVCLRELHTSACELEDIRCIFSTPKENLKVLSITNIDPCKAEQIMEICNIGTEEIEQFCLQGGSCPPGTFDKFSKKHKSSLTSVFLPIGAWEDDKLEELIQQLSSLKEFGFWGYPSMNIQKILHDRGIQFRNASGFVYYAPKYPGILGS